MMKKLIGSALSALILTTSAAAIATPVKYKQLNTQAQSQIAYQINVPHITGSGVRNNAHFIQVAVVGMSLQDLMISLPDQMERFNSVEITDQSGKQIAAKTEISKERIAITFEQPVTSGGVVEVNLTGIRTRSSGVRTLLYGVTGQRVGLKGDIPIGTARIDLLDQS
ncbi:hypothetical protein NIES2107_31600 [Nostoc carneum NIES-2107]|nr:hypothetical protein NIES2107_31600 [Nostoc carneum NIES-2107]